MSMTPEEIQIAIEERRRYQRERMRKMRKERPEHFRELQLQTYLNRYKKRKAQEERQKILDSLDEEKNRKA